MEGRTDTERGLVRKVEEKKYIPVIIKRNDETVRHPDDVLEAAIAEGLEQLERSTSSLFISAVAAGLILGFAALAVSIAYQIVPEGNELHNRLAMALVYPLGFIICIMSGSQLFTEHTALALYPCLDRKSGILPVMRVLSVVILGNIIGTIFSSLLIFLTQNVTLAATGTLAIAEHLIHFSFFEIFVSAVLAGWLMALGSWLVLATPPSTSQILCIYVVTFTIGFGGLHHSIAGSAEVFSGYFISNFSYKTTDILEFLVASLSGNFVGGSLFVAALNYAHIRSTQAKRE